MTRTLFPLIVLFGTFIQLSMAQAPMKWKIHDLNRPNPPIITPGTPSTQETPGTAPSDAVVLFDGKDLSKWADKDGKPAQWKVQDGYMEVVAKTGNISTRDSFGDCQLHVEFDNRQRNRSEEHTSELQSHSDLVCRLLLEKKKKKKQITHK